MRLWRLCLAGLVYDWLVFVAWTLIPIRAEGMGASPTQLGLLQGASTIAYVAGCLLVGRMADRGHSRLFVLIGCLGAAVACHWVGTAPTVTLLIGAVAVMGLANSLFWPSAQGTIGAETEPGRLDRAIGLFNVMWSAGKGLGYLMAGWMTRSLGDTQVMWVAGASALPILAFYPWRKGVRANGGAAPLARPEGAVFRSMAWAANFIGYGALNTFQNQYYKYLLGAGQGDEKWAKPFFGLFLGVLIAAQTVVFILMQRNSVWAYRRRLLYAVQVLMAAATLAIPFVRGELPLLVLAPLVGIGAGFVNGSSIYYSLHGPADHSKFAGLHEAILSAGAFAVPMAGGLLADAAGDLRMPYLLSGTATLLAILLQEALYRSRPRS